MYIAIWYLSLTYFRGSKALTQVEDGIFRLHTSTCTPGWLEPEADDWDSWGTILLPPHQPTREGLHTLYLSCTPSFANKRFFLETHQEVDLFWALADQTLFLAPFNASCTVLHHNLVSVDWHMSKWTQVWFNDDLFSLEQLLWIRTFLRSEACCKASAYGTYETEHKWKKVILYFITRTIFTPWEFLLSFAYDLIVFPNMLRQSAW